MSKTKVMADNKTRIMTDNKTQAMNAKNSHRLYLQDDIIFEGKNDKYEIYSKQIIGEGGESIVYKAKRLSNDEEVAAKIHDKYNPNDFSNNLNRDLVIEFLNTNSNYQETHLMPLYDHGDIILNVNDRVYTLPIDIMPYCKDDTLSSEKN